MALSWRTIDLKFSAGPPLGRLARWLRILGLDCRYLPEPENNGDISKYAEDHILLTRRTDIKGKNVVFIGEDRVENQLKILSQLVPIKDLIRPFSRCVECNVPLKDISKDEARPIVPEYVYLTQEDFKICPLCGRVFWPGTHRNRMEIKIKEIFG